MSGWIVRGGNTESVCILDSPRDATNESQNLESIETEPKETELVPSIQDSEPFHPIPDLESTEIKPLETKEITLVAEEESITEETPEKPQTPQTPQTPVHLENIEKHKSSPCIEDEKLPIAKKVEVSSSRVARKRKSGERKRILQQETLRSSGSCPNVKLTIDHQSLQDVRETHPPHDKKLEATKKKSNEVFEELLGTERVYLENLRIIVDVFLRPLQKKETLNKVQLSNVFSNVEALYEQVNVKLLSRLESLQSSDNRLAEIGDLFSEFAPLFKLYAVYCSNQPNIHSRVVQFKEENDDFAQYLIRAQRKPQCRKLDVESFLITPLQRLCKYPLLLRELLKCTSVGQEAHKKLTAAVESIGEIVSKVNERVRKIENLNKLIFVNNGITFSSECKFDLLGDHNRVFMLDEEFLYNFKEVHGYLFNDVMLFARENKAGVYQIDQVLWLAGCTVVSVEALNPDDPKHEIELTELNQEIGCILSFSTKFKKKKWLKALNSAIGDAPEPPAIVMRSQSRTPILRTKGSSMREKLERRGSRTKSLRRTGVVKSIAQQFEHKEPAEIVKKISNIHNHSRTSAENKQALQIEYKKKYEEEVKLRLNVETLLERKINELEELVKVLQSENTFLKERMRADVE